MSYCQSKAAEQTGRAEYVNGRQNRNESGRGKRPDDPALMKREADFPAMKSVSGEVARGGVWDPRRGPQVNSGPGANRSADGPARRSRG